MDSITITRPDDWHVHLRDNEFLAVTVADMARSFGRAIVMPNLKPPVVTCDDALAYRDRILANIPAGAAFEPLMVLYLTDNTTPAEIEKAAQHPNIHAVKYYPAGATTNSDAGVSSLSKCYDTLAAMEQHQLPLLIHGEVTDPDIDIFDRERVFIERELSPLLARFPKLKVVLEHITTKDAVEFVAEAPNNIAATLTPQHILYNRNDMLVGGIRPHYYCLPILKRNIHQQALLAAATSGSPKFFLGTDSAPHLRHTKETGCGCAGCYTAPHALSLYAEAFEAVDALDKLEAFASHYGPDFYGLPRNTDQITLVKQDWTIPADIAIGEHTLHPLRGGETIAWQVSPT